MDAVELTRQAAAQHHFNAVAKGLNSRDPYAFAVAEAKRRNLDVETAVPGAALLDGGRATLIAKDALILHENIGTPFEQAYLVAHEIGHADCGDDGEEAVPPTIDPTRSAEPSPTGLDRVVDYGRRQRREIQMDLFAREFLLPRALVRKLHLQDNLTASAIAEQFGAPVEIVYQQLLDALLLPPIPASTESDVVEKPPNDSQRAAAAHRGPAYLLEAGPGTGKTQTLVLRVEGLLSEGVDPRRILLLTFSNKAAGEMAERIARLHPEAAKAMWIGTFHAFGLDLIRRFHAELGLSPDARMLDRTEAVELLEQEFPNIGLVHYRDLYDPTENIADILAAISRAKDEVVDENEYRQLAEAMLQRATTDDQRVAAEKAVEVARVYTAYEAIKRKMNCIDFGDLVSRPVRLFERDDSIRSYCQKLYNHVLVDEYQDVNRSSVRLLIALRGTGENLWAVGDARQSIYRFRGASSFNLARFGKEDFSGGQRGWLDINYRSVAEIVDTFTGFASTMKVGSMSGKLSANRGSAGVAPHIRTVSTAEQQPVALADRIIELQKFGYAYRENAVLCTGNEALANLDQDLERLGLPVLYLGSLFERAEVKDMLSLLSLLVDRRAMGLTRLACQPEFKMTVKDVSAVLDHLRLNDAPPCSWLQSPPDGLSHEGKSAVAKLAEVLKGVSQDATPWSVLAAVLLDRTRVAANLATSDKISDKAKGIALWQFLNFAKTQPAAAGLPIQRFLDRIRRLLRLGDDRDLRQLPTAAQHLDAVRLMTIHGAKGLEFPSVHLVGLNQGTLPRTAPAPVCPPPDGMIAGGTGNALDDFRSASSAEQECLFFVALSRARDRLTLYAPIKNAIGAKRPISEFVGRLGKSLTRDNIEPSRCLPPPPEEADVPLAVEGVLSFSNHQLSLYGRCPRRFFYTHVLQVGGRRSPTGFTQMHDAVREVFQSVVTGKTQQTDDELSEQLTAAFMANGLADHGYVNEYREFATRMVRFFVGSRQGHVAELPVALRLTFGGEEIIVLPDDVLIRSDGVRMLRSVRTGHRRSADAKDIGTAAFLLAAQQTFPDAVVELVYLSDECAEPVVLTKTELLNRQKKLNEFLQDIRQGRFPAVPSTRVCPSCPAFFICGPTPDGVLARKF